MGWSVSHQCRKGLLWYRNSGENGQNECSQRRPLRQGKGQSLRSMVNDSVTSHYRTASEKRGTHNCRRDLVTEAGPSRLGTLRRGQIPKSQVPGVPVEGDPSSRQEPPSHHLPPAGRRCQPGLRRSLNGMKALFWETRHTCNFVVNTLRQLLEFLVNSTHYTTL